jgi:Domain of unknown function (DUF397)
VIWSEGEAIMTEAVWRKSSFSGNEGACVELAHTATSGAIRDSKNPDGGQLVVPLGDLIDYAKSSSSTT